MFKAGASRSGCVLMVAVLLLLSGCGGKPFNVKPRPDTPPPAAGVGVRVGDLSVEASAVRDEDYLYETFDANLILAGVLPVRLVVTNGGQQAVDLKKGRFELRRQGGQTFKAVDARRAYKRVLSYYQITTYSKDGYKQSQSDFASHALDVNAPLGPGETRAGLIFFPVPADSAAEADLMVVIRRLGDKQSKSDAVELKLDRERL